jgi:hypothetical protein
MKTQLKSIVKSVPVWVAVLALVVVLSWRFTPLLEAEVCRVQTRASFEKALEQAANDHLYFPPYSFSEDPQSDNWSATSYSYRLAQFNETSLLRDPLEADLYRLLVTNHLEFYRLIVRIEIADQDATVFLTQACSGQPPTTTQLPLTSDEVATFLEDLKKARFWSSGNPHFRLATVGQGLSLTPWLAEGRRRTGYQVFSSDNIGLANLVGVHRAFMRAARNPDFDAAAKNCSNAI